MTLTLQQPNSEIYIPDGSSLDAALSRTTHLGVAAHPDDLELLAVHGILECYADTEQWFTGVVLCDGAGSPRTGAYAGISDSEMRHLRRREQKMAARVGRYSAVIMLDYPSQSVKSGHIDVASDLRVIIDRTTPRVVYTHNPADRHDTHVAVALRCLRAFECSPHRPQTLLGCEVWGSLDWLPEPKKVKLAVSGHQELQAQLIACFESQVRGGKRYDRGALGRRHANATFMYSDQADHEKGMVYAMDLMPLLSQKLEVAQYLSKFLDSFRADVMGRLSRLS